ncbi:MAG TPA: hypothetical protein VGL71_01475 [Urbifossiella sp.]
MPIRFRCHHCERLLGIARRKAGTAIHCPQCGVGITVPHEDEQPDRTLYDVDELLGPPPVNGIAIPEPAPEPAELVGVTQDFQFIAPSRPVLPQPMVPAVSPPIPRPTPKRKPMGEMPLFEQSNMDALLGLADAGGLLELDEPSKVKPVSGMDALSLDEGPGKIVLSSQKATLLVIAAALLMILAFAVGYGVGSRG